MDLLLVAGLWLDPSVWDDVVAGLAARGHRGIAVALPGQGDGRTDATLDDQRQAVLDAVDAADRPVVVGHSAAASLAWLAADARPSAVRATVLVGGFPSADGAAYADFFPLVEGAMPFPGWAAFEGPDSADLDEAARDALAARAIPVPGAVAQGVVRLADERRYDVPVVLVCPEFSPDDARAWVASGDVPELARARDVTYVDLPTGHWPMVSAPQVLVAALADVADGL
ncbi:alpha/beta fold hydrolase [Cellulomonas marina]|uniref:Pimeloyl-ACP methyl ester carboxylesterase n=1 Tax=Cellulomonas marina TaxID=988821 RepID=A0A1I0Z9T7_9CELL|nr:alpha/beta hydrolase [Cellulomonas marina]GIG29020.1 esterase [Cellulomonas marina]SFB22107.1 Pimeloyl-ACP methyl ester carboxylesterase [Cellulomonas marina]